MAAVGCQARPSGSSVGAVGGLRLSKKPVAARHESIWNLRPLQCEYAK